MIRFRNRDEATTTGINTSSGVFSLKSVRRSKGYTNKQFVDRVRREDSRFDVSILSKLENEYVLPTPKMIRIFCSVLECKVTDLYK